MAEKLAEATWTGFTKKQKLDLDDAALLKALAKFDKSDAGKPELQLAALDDIVEQIKKQVVALTKRKKELGDKPFNEAKDKLNGLLEAAEAAQKSIRSTKAADSEDEEDSPALMTTRMLPLLRELRKGEGAMHALICTAGKNTAVLIMRRAIATTRRKMLSDQVGAQGGAKFIVGECVYDESALTFSVQGQAAGLAKRLRQALLDQTGQRLKVRVRGEDGAMEDEGEDEGEGAQAQEQPAGVAEPSAAEVAYAARLDQIGPLLDAALKAKHAESTKLRALSGFASEKAGAQDFAGATKALDMMLQLLGAKGSAAPQANARQLEAALEVWRTERSKVVERLRALTKEIADAKLPDAKEAIIEVSAVFKQLTAEPRTGQQVKELTQWLLNDDVVDDVCEISEDIRTPLLEALQGVQRAIEAA